MSCDHTRRDRNAPESKSKIKVVPDEDVPFLWFADLISRIKYSSESGERLVMILPNPWPSYRHVARIINACQLDCRNVWAFAMDEYADQDGNIAPESWEFGFSHAMLKYFYYEIDESLRPPREQFVCFAISQSKTTVVSLPTSAAPTSVTRAPAGQATSRSSNPTRPSFRHLWTSGNRWMPES